MVEEPDEFATQIADQIKGFWIALKEVAREATPGEAVSMLLIAVSQLLLAGGRLGAVSDIVLTERFEPDTGADPDLDELRAALAALLDPIDEYAEVFDPYEPRPELMICRISDDLAGVAAALLHVQVAEARGFGEGGRPGAAERARGVAATDEERGADCRDAIVEAAGGEACQHLGAAFD